MPLHFIARNEGFKCLNCQKKILPLKSGGKYRNHCPFCLFSRHVDGSVPGDRKSLCKGLMKPVSVFTKKTGEYVLVNQCKKCGFIRYNRIAGDDDFEIVLKLSKIPSPCGAQ